MSEPIVFISHFKVKEGKLDGLKQFAQATTEQIGVEKGGCRSIKGDKPLPVCHRQRLF